MKDVIIKHSTIPERIYSLHRSIEDGKNRPHLGASVIGNECERYLWFVFRWVLRPEHSGRMLRLFKRGFLEEIVLIKELTDIGIKVEHVNPKTGAQLRFEKFNGHFSGSIDGLAMGIPEAPKTKHLLEFKTSNDKQFKRLKSMGVEDAKPLHYAQIQVYMKEFGLTRALYIAVNKNDDNVYTERIAYNANAAIYFIKLARKIILLKQPPEILNPNSPTCHWCEFKDVCHGNRIPQANCRTCAHSTPQIQEESEPWICEKYDNGAINLESQRDGGDCPNHVFISSILSEKYSVIESEKTWVKYRTTEGEDFYNGYLDTLKEKNHFTSREMEKMKPGQFQLVNSVKKTFGGACLVRDSRGIEHVHDPDFTLPY